MTQRSDLPSPRCAPSPAVAGHRPLALVLAIAGCFAGAGDVLAQATGAQAVHGAATLTQQGQALTITTQNGVGTSHSAINWQSFGVPAGTTTYFAQPTAQSTSINRVLGANPSAIFGTLGSNGKLVLVNPAGITVGAGAVVDTAGFTASALRMSDADALAGRMAFGGSPLSAGAVSVDGRVLARSGDILLIAPSVQTGAGALLQAPGGATLLAAGQQVEVTGRGLEGIRMQLQAPTDQAINLGTLQGDAVGVFAGQLRHSGLVQASAATADGGRVLLQAAGDAQVSGTITAARGAVGGSIGVTGARVQVQGSAVLDASGAQGGGEVLVGGGWQGQDTRLPNARSATVDKGAQLRADAGSAGDGGAVVVWSDGATSFAGSISARGGAASGNGGRAETSGKGTLTYRGHADLGAAHGTAGTLLLDPTTITIAGGSGDGDDSSSSTTSLDGAPTGTVAAADTPSAFTVYQSEIQGTSANIVLKATDGITALGFTNALSLATNSSLSLETTGGSVGTGVDLTNIPEIRTFGSGAVSIKTNAASQAVKLGSVTTAGGGITVDSKGPVDISSATLKTSGGAISVTGVGTLASGVNISGSSLVSGAGSLTLTATTTAAAFPALNIEKKLLGANSLLSGGTVQIDGTGGTFGTGVSDSSVRATDGLTLGSTTDRVLLQGVSITASGGALLVRAKGVGASTSTYAANSLNIIDSSGTTSLIDNTGSGTVTLTGQLTSHNASNGAYSGMLLKNTTVQSAGGAISLQGQSGDVTGVANAMGVLLDAGAKVQNTGTGVTSLGITGRVGVVGDQASKGVVIAAAASVGSANGNITISGQTQGPATAGVGVSIAGNVTAGNALSVTGSLGAGQGIGVELLASSTLKGGAGGVSVTGSAATTNAGFSVTGTSVGGTVSATGGGGVSIAGTVAAPAPATGTYTGVLVASGGKISALGTGTITVGGTGVPAPSPVGSYDIDQQGTISSAGGQIKFTADRLNIANTVSATSSGRILAVPTTAARAITIGGTTGEDTNLNLSAAEIGQMTASVLAIGDTGAGGSIVQNGNLAVTNVANMSLTSDGSVTQSGGATLSVGGLNAVSKTAVTFTGNNALQRLSGKFGGANSFSVTSTGAPAPAPLLAIDTVDGVSGIGSFPGADGSVIVSSPNAPLKVNQNVLSGAAGGSVSLTGQGITVTNAATVGSPAGNVTLAGGSSYTVDSTAGTLSSGGTSASAVLVSSAALLKLGAVSASSGGLTLNVTGPVTQPAGALNISSLTVAMSGGALDLSATANEIGSLVSISNSGGGVKIRDNAGGLLFTGGVSASGALDIATASGSINTGSGTVSAPSITLQAAGTNADLTIGGSLSANSGTVSLTAARDIAFTGTSASFTSSGGPATLTATGIKLTTGNTSFNSGLVTGATPFAVSGAGTLTAGANITIPRLQLDGGGTVNGNGNISVSTQLSISGGTLSGTGSLDLPSAAVATTTGPFSLARPINNSGTFNLANLASTSGNGTVFTNLSGGMLQLTAAGGFSGDNVSFETINNASGATISKLSGSTASFSNVSFSNSGTLNVAASTAVQLGTGAMTANSGTINLGAGATLVSGGGNLTNTSTGLIQGSGLLDLSGATLTNNGVIRPGGAGTVGTLTVQGAINTSNGALTTEIDSGGYDVLSVSGNITVSPASTFNVIKLSGAAYAAGAAFDVIQKTGTAVSPAGTMTSPSGFTASLVAAPPSIRLTAQNAYAPPPPPAGPAPAPSASPAPSPTVSPAPTPSPSATSAPSPTPAPSASPTPAPTSAPTAAPTSAPTSAPTPAPTSAPAPASDSSSRVDAFVEALRGAGTAGSTDAVIQKVTQAITELDGKLATFATLLVKEATAQADQKKKDERGSAISVTDTQCKSS